MEKKRDLVKQFEEFCDSDEGKAFFDEMRKRDEVEKRWKDRLEKYAEEFHYFDIDKKCELIDKYIEKVNACTPEWKYEKVYPHNLTALAGVYGKKYGHLIAQNSDSDYRDVQYSIINDRYVVNDYEYANPQYFVEKQDCDNNVIFKHYENPPVEIYSMDDEETPLLVTTNEYTFLDICAQIREKNLVGKYFVKFKDSYGDVHRLNFGLDGRIKGAPHEMFRNMSDLLDRCFGF